MYCKVHPPINTPGVSDNKGSCKQLVEYLSKESMDERPYYDNFFSQTNDFVEGKAVQRHINHNHRTLKKNEDKFYMLSVNPSGQELRHFIKKVTGKDTGDFSSLPVEDREKVIAGLKVYARGCMDEYARNFYREKIRDGNDLAWYGRVETERHYKPEDEEVKQGSAQAGDKKPGLQLHVHIIVSRMDKSQTISLSPLAKSRGNVQLLDGREVTVGFDRSEWASRCASRFAQDYNYFPYYLSGSDYAKRACAEWQARNAAKNKAMAGLKREVLQGELRPERQLYMNTLRVYRFVVNPKAALLSELKHAGLDLLKGKGL